MTLCMSYTKATHAYGGDLTYEWVAGNSYKFKLSFYADCISPILPKVPIKSSSLSCVVNQQWDTLFLVSYEDVSQVCDTNLLQCNGGSLPGLRKMVYESATNNNVTLSSCSDWVVSYSHCCRISSITNFVNSSSYNFYVETTLDNTVFQNNKSPYFADNPRWMIPVNQTSFINAGAYDADGDSLYFSLLTPQHDNGVPMAYNIGYSNTQPFGGTVTSINNQTGIITTTPSNLGRYLITAKVDEFRNGQLISSVKRDFMVNVYNSSNTLPEITNTSLDFNVCTVDTLNVDLYSADAVDSVFTEILYPFNPGSAPYFSNATFPPFNRNTGFLNDTSSLVWQPLGLNPNRDYYIYVNVQDDNCDINNVQSYAVKVTTSYCVWPGDANSDLIADVFDILPIGVYNTFTGTTRPNASLNWTGQWSQNWGTLQASGDDIKHVDCNGDGVIGVNDAPAILLNYNLTHLKKGGSIQGGVNSPSLYVDITPDTIGTSSALSIPIMLGTSLTPADSVYGVVLRLSYDPTKIDSAAGITVDYSNSWLGTQGTDMITIDTNFYNNGQIDIGIVRTDGQMMSGFGEIVTLNAITVDNLSGKTSTFGSLIVDFIDAKIIDNNEADRQFSQQLDSVVIEDVALGINTSELNQEVLIVPNPNNGSFKIHTTNEIESLEIYDISGKAVQFDNIVEKNVTIVNLQKFNRGIYFIKIIDKKGLLKTKKIIIN